MNRFVIRTQTLENYGAHCEDGKFSSGNAYWKFKSGNDYLVYGLDRMQDAVAFVMAAFSENEIGYKEFPIEFLEEHEWLAQLPEDEEYRKFLLEQVLVVSPAKGRDITKGYPPE